MKTVTIALSSLLLLAVAALFVVFQSKEVSGGAFTGSAAVISTATTTTVGPDTNVTIFSKKTSCTSRIITTNYGAIRFTTGDVTGFGSTTLANGNGMVQAASTTVAYDSGLYGCGLWTAEALATTTITIVENQ